MGLTRADMATAARDYLHELGTDYVTGTILNRALNRAARRLQRKTKYYRADYTIPIYSGAREYTVAASAIEVYRCRLSPDYKRLTPTDVHAKDRDDADWEGGTAAEVTHYYLDANTIGFDPKPYTASAWTNATAYAEGTRVVPSAARNGWYYKCTSAGTSSGTEPTWPTTSGGTVSDGTVEWQRDVGAVVYAKCAFNAPALQAGTAPSWLPGAYHDTIPKGAAIDLAGGFDAENPASSVRKNHIYAEYLQEEAELTGIANNRSKEYVGRMTPKGYGTYRR